MAVYGPVCHPQNIISKTKNEFEQNPEENIIWTGPGLYTAIWTASLTKTNRENINVNYNIYIIVTDMEGNIRIYRLPKGRGTDQWK